MDDQIENVEFLNPNKAWVVRELDKIYSVWKAWEEEVSRIVDQPYDRTTQSGVFADGEV